MALASKNKVFPLQVSDSDGLNELEKFPNSCSDSENEPFTQLQLEELWDKVPGLIARSKIYPILDACEHRNHENESPPPDLTQICVGDGDITEEEILSNLEYTYGNGAGDQRSNLAYTVCLEYLLKSKLKFCNTAEDLQRPSSSSYYNTRLTRRLNSSLLLKLRKYRKSHSNGISFHGKLRNLTKHVQKIKSRSKSEVEHDKDPYSAISSTSSSEHVDNTSCDSHHETSDIQEHRNKNRRRRKLRVGVQTNYLFRSHVRRGNKSRVPKRRHSQRHYLSRNKVTWSNKCCSKKPVLNSRNTPLKSFLEFSAVIVFLIFFIMIYIDTTSQLRESFPNYYIDR